MMLIQFYSIKSTILYVSEIEILNILNILKTFSNYIIWDIPNTKWKIQFSDLKVYPAFRTPFVHLEGYFTVNYKQR